MIRLRQVWDDVGFIGLVLAGGGLLMAGGGLFYWMVGGNGVAVIGLVVLGIISILVELARHGLMPGTRVPITGVMMAASSRAAGQLAIDIYDPAERQRLMALSPNEQDAIMVDIMREIPELAHEFAQANSWWKLFPGRVVATAQKAIPGITRPEVAAMVASYRRIQRS